MNDEPEPEPSERRLAAIAACRQELRAGLRRAEEREAAWAKARESQEGRSLPTHDEMAATRQGPQVSVPPHRKDCT
jgi:hypothetical protein